MPKIVNNNKLYMNMCFIKCKRKLMLELSQNSNVNLSNCCRKKSKKMENITLKVAVANNWLVKILLKLKKCEKLPDK